MKLNLGVIDVPYAFSPGPVKAAKKGKKAKRTKVSGVVTTGDVATILEAHYGVMAYFWEKHQQEIADLLANSLKGALETLMMGGPPAANPYAGAESDIEKMFRHFLDAREMDGQPGVPTKAAQDGVNPRKKLKKGPPRPSFIASGLYQSHFKAWMERNG